MQQIAFLRHFSASASILLLSLLFADAQPGTVDPLFPVAVSNTVHTLLAEPNDNIVLLGPFSHVNGQSRNTIARLLPEGVLDETFNPSLGSNGIVAAAAIQSDGKWIIAGVFDSVNGVARPSIARLHPDGTLDLTFAPALSLAPVIPPPPWFPGPAARPDIELVAVQPDGGVLIGNTYLIKRSDGSELPGTIVRLNADGSLDENFHAITNVPTRMKVLSDGSLLVAERTYLVGQDYKSVLWKYHADGSLDTSFQRPSPNGFINALDARDSMIVVGGSFFQVNGLGHLSIVRLHSDGSLDNSFHPDLQGLQRSVHALHLQKDGKLVVTGDFLAPGLVDRINIVRFNPDGTVDEDFAPVVPDAAISALVEQSSGKLVIGGDFTQINRTNRTHIARLNGDKNDSPGVFTVSASRFECVESSLAVTIRVQRIQGTIGDVSVDYRTVDGSARSDTDYEPISGTLSFADGEFEKTLIISIHNDSQIEDLELFQVQLLNPSNGTTLGSVSAATIAILDDDGPASFDPTFRLGPDSLDLDVRVIAVQADGKVLISGYFNRVDWTVRSGIARLNDDGTLDPSFDPGPGVRAGQYPGSVSRIRVQADQKILTSGVFTSANGVNRNGMARWNPDGTVDLAFNVGAGPREGNSLSEIRDFDLLNTGKILAVGGFYTFGGFWCNGLVRVNEDGSPDTSYDSYNPSFAGSFVWAMSLEPSSMIAVGYRAAYRIDSTGKIDPGFGVQTDSYIRDVKVLPDGKILVCGWFNQVNGTSARQVARLNPDGSVDGTFNCDLSLFMKNGYPPYVYKLALHPDGGIVLGFADYGTPRGTYVLRLKPNGELDADFEPVRFSWQYPGDNELINDIAVQNNGAILVGGGFTLVNGLPRPYLVRLKGTSDGAVRLPAITAISTSSENPVVIDATVAPAKLFVLETSNDLVHWQALSTNFSMSTSVRLIQSQSGNLRAFYRIGTISK